MLALWRRSGRFLQWVYRLPEVDCASMVGEVVPIPPPILDHLCLPTLGEHFGHDDYVPLMRIAQAVDPSAILEYGTGFGGLTANLCRILPAARVLTVNALPEDLTGMITTIAPSREEIGSVYRKYGFTDRVTQVYANTRGLNLSDYLAERTVDLAVIDACHDVRYVMHDFLSIVPFISSHGVVLLHDTHPSMEKHLGPSYAACLLLRLRGYDIRHIAGAWWGIWRRDWHRSLHRR